MDLPGGAGSESDSPPEPLSELSEPLSKLYSRLRFLAFFPLAYNSTQVRLSIKQVEIPLYYFMA